MNNLMTKVYKKKYFPETRLTLRRFWIKRLRHPGNVLAEMCYLYRRTHHQSFFQEGSPGNQLTLGPHHQAQARPSTGAAGLGLPSKETRRMSASIGIRVGSYRMFQQISRTS